MMLGEILVDDEIDEKLAMKKKLAKQKQQSWNRGRTELLGSDHKQTRAAIRSELEPGYKGSSSGKKAIRVLHRLASATCYRELTTCRMSPLASRSLSLMPMTRFASGVQSRLSSGQIQVSLERTLPHPAMSDANVVVCSAERRVPLNSGAPGSAEPLKNDVSASHDWDCNNPSVPGRFWWGTEEFYTEIGFPLLAHVVDVIPTPRDNKLCRLLPLARCVCYSCLFYVYEYGRFELGDLVDGASTGTCFRAPIEEQHDT